MSRRLSKGSNASLMDFESDDENAEADSAGGANQGLHAMGKNRSSLGGSKSKLNPTEQARIADMYKTVIKLAAENVSPSCSVRTKVKTIHLTLFIFLHPKQITENYSKKLLELGVDRSHG
jgi:hypothetical protein